MKAGEFLFKKGSAGYIPQLQCPVKPRAGDALMIADTSFLRKANYHNPGDAPETVDYERMAAVVEQTFRALMREAAPQ